MLAVTVKELRELLADLPEDMQVVMSKDGEGNSYSPLSDGSSNYIYVPECTWSGDVYSTDHSAEDMDMDEEDWEEFKATNDRALVLWPTN